jgi:type I restriction enzyme M protein
MSLLNLNFVLKISNFNSTHWYNKQIQGVFMSNKKEIERTELHRTIWQIANDLRGSVDGWDFKQYVLGMLFYRFISENLSLHVNTNQRKAGFKDFNYRDLTDEKALSAKKQIIDEKGFFILPSKLFSNVTKNAVNNENLNMTLEKVFKDIEASAMGTQSEDSFKGLFDDLNVNSNKLGGTVVERNTRLAKLLRAIDGLDFGDFTGGTIDLFGDAYEYLMTMYAANAGKSGGEFFTPQEVSELLARIAIIDFNSPDRKFKEEVNKVYDPACGSGSLLLKISKIIGKGKVKQGYYGQEINLTTYNLARINMFLHDIPFDKFNLAYGDTLMNPKHWDDKPFDAIVSNPPYSIKWEGDSNSLLINDPRFAPAGVLAPKSKADFAFVLHILSWLSSSGTAAIVEFPGILYRGGAEQKIRKYLVDNNYIDTIIQLPPDLFFGSTISTIIMVLRKNKTDSNILFIDASKEFVRFDIKNKLSDTNIDRLLNTIRQRTKTEYFSKNVSFEDIVAKDYNLSVNTYVSVEDTSEVINIKELNKKINEITSKSAVLRNAIDSIVQELEGDSNE